MNSFLLDTHVWLWAQRRDEEQISAEVFAEIEAWQRAGQAYLSPISVWEVALLSTRNLVELGMPIDQFVREATEDGGLQFLPLTPNLLIEATRLPGDLHRDPADRMLVATARGHGLTLVTRDKLLLQYAKQGHLNARKP